MNTYTIRRATVQDATAIARIYRYYVENTAVTFEVEPPTEEEIGRRIAAYSARYPYLCIFEDNAMIGFAFAHAFRERPAYDYAAETSIYIRPDRRHKGVGTIIYQALENELRRMGVKTLYACIAIPDGEDARLSDASPLFHEKRDYRTCGRFENCGRKFGRWYTMVWMEKVIGEYTSDPAPLIPYPDLDDRY